MQVLFFFVLSQATWFKTDAKYIVSDELESNSITNDWYDLITSNQLQQCRKNEDINSLGMQQGPSKIYWKKAYNLLSSSRLDIFIEYQLSGVWNGYNLDFYVNQVLVATDTVQLVDTNRPCNTNFLYESSIYIVIAKQLDNLILEIKVNQANLGLYIQNIIINQRTQDGRNVIIPFIDSVINCRSGSGLQFVQYYCKCPSTQVYQINQCLSTCSQNYLYNPSTNECYFKANCDACKGLNTVLTCNSGYFSYLSSDPVNSACLERCPGDYYSDSNIMKCTLLQDYLKTNENNGYPVDHFFFYRGTADFFHFFSYNDIIPSIRSVPLKAKERAFVYVKDKFVAGSYETFQSQTLMLSLKVVNSQYKLRFRAIGHFIDFVPSSFNIYINGVLQPDCVLLPSNDNQMKTDQDYIAYFDYNWTRTELYPVAYNNILFQVEQPLQNGVYQGYFYIEDIHIFQFRCLTGCDSCYTIAYCTPCLNPAHKDPSDCTCLSGYLLQNDICVACPEYCLTCVQVGICSGCKTSTKRLNSPACDTCPDQYYISPDEIDCQQCQIGCKICTTGQSCNVCLSGYFKDLNSQCVTQCADGYFNDNSDPNNPICSLCSNTCLKCQSLATTCTACVEKKTLINNKCYGCSDGQYLSGITCLSCTKNCLQCSGSPCQKCLETYFLQQSTAQCVSSCDSNQYGNIAARTCESCDSTCLTCLGSTSSDCLSCPQGKVLNVQNTINGQCQTNCLVGYYRSGEACAKCWKGCTQCTDSTQACLICAPKYYRLKSNGNCYDQCPDGYYNNKLGYVCSTCDTICKTCNGGSTTNCLSCNSPLAYYQNQCVANCPSTYGNVNSVCQQCSANCESCFGTGPSQCLSCSIGFYYLKNQCYTKCPKFFVGVRPQYICKCIYEVCVECLAAQFFYNNHCYDVCPEGAFGFNGLCLKCDITCGTCFGEDSDQCLSCNSPLILYNKMCVTDCSGNTYHDVTSNQCLYCDDSCQACTGPNNNDCTACYDPQLITADGTCADTCSDSQFLIISERRCERCHPSCLTCFSSSNDSCLTCSNLFYLYQCVDSCPDGFQISANQIACEPNFVITIPQCSYQCTTCNLVPRFCTACFGNRVPNPPNCDCDKGYYDDGVSSNCKPCNNKCSSCTINANSCTNCKGDRLLPNCTCPFFYYDDGQSLMCQKCPDNCASCNANGCITCLTNRIDSPDCICPDGYYEAYQTFCQQCAKKCITCSNTDQFCQTCSDIRENPPICNCPEGYFENSDQDCQQCSATCIDCNLTGCLTCFGNRVGPVGGQCTCPSPAVSRIGIGSLYCTDCSLGVPYFGLNSDFTGFYFDFGGQVKLLIDETKDFCSQIFDDETYIKLGTQPQCDNDRNVLFGNNPTLEVGDQLKLKPQFQLFGCKEQFHAVQAMPLTIPSTFDLSSHKPVVKFKEIVSPNVCAPIFIEFEQKLYNGKRIFKILSWTMNLPTQPDLNIDTILQANTANNSETIVFPVKSLSPNQQYKFSVLVKSFAQLTNSIFIEFIPIAQSTIIFKSNLIANQFHRFETITIPFTISYYNCIEKNPPSQTLFYQIILQNTKTQLLNGSITEGLLDGYSVDVVLTINPYYLNFTNPYILVFSTILTRADYKIETSDKSEIYIISSAPTLVIEGGNRMIGYDTTLYLNTTIKDQDYTQAEMAIVNYECHWECTDIVNGTNCQDQFQQVLVFDQKCQQSIQGKTFSPYQVFFISVTIMKNQIAYTTKISLQVVELDLPSLNATGVDESKFYNYYDEFIYKLNYPGINPDLLMYAGAVIYSQITYATFEFHYLELKFKLGNYFTSLTQEQGNQAQLRLSIYDPRFIMPSINTQILKMNIPPSFCQLQHDQIENPIEFLDMFNMTIIGCQDEDLPLMYSVQLYPNQTIYEFDLIQANFYHYILILPPQQQNNLVFTLPYLDKASSYLVIIIEDTKGGITNLTTSVSVRQFEQIDEETIIDYQNKQATFDQQLIGYRIISERLTYLEKLIIFKQHIFNKIIQMDQNLTYLSNQTESIYHSISILVGQNSSLLQINETMFFGQLNYRISLALSSLDTLFNLQKNNQMTSSQNIEKINYIKQCQTFANILSSAIKFKVTFNTSATEIQKSLKQIVNKLQEISVANEPLYKVDTNSANLNFGYLTSKIAQTVTGISFASNNSDYNSSTNFFKYSQTRYLDNPYYTTSGFPKNSSGFQAVDPQIDSKGSETPKLSTPMQFSFPNNKVLPTNTSLKCISQLNSSKWSPDICKTVNNKGNLICQCTSLNPTSIMESLNQILDKGADVYSLDTLLAFASFPFYKTLVFYFYLAITGLYLTIIYWGMKVDNIMYQKIQNEQNLVENVLNEEQLNIQSLKEIDPKQQDSLENREINQQDQQVIVRRTIFREVSFRILQIVKGQPEKPNLNTANEINLAQQQESSQIIMPDEYPPRSPQTKNNPENTKKITKVRAYIHYLKYFHQILSIIYKDDEKQPRALRATVVYTGIMGSLAVLFVFNDPNNLSLTIALAIITAPINKIYQICLEKLLTNKRKLIRSLGGGIMIVGAGFISYTMLAGLVLSGSVETANKWSYIFIGTFSVDNIVYSPIQLVLQYCVHIGLINFPTLQKLLQKFLDEKGKEILKDIFIKAGLL